MDLGGDSGLKQGPLGMQFAHTLPQCGRVIAFGRNFYGKRGATQGFSAAHLARPHNFVGERGQAVPVLCCCRYFKFR